MVEELFTMREFGIVTRPLAAMRKSEVVALPFALVEEAMSTMGVLLSTQVRCIPAVAHGEVVPRVNRVAKRLWSVDDAVAITPWVKLIRVEVASQVVSVVKGKAKSDEDDTLLLNTVQSAEARQPKMEPEAVSQAMSSLVKVRPAPPVRLVSVEISIAVPRSAVTLPFTYVRPVENVVVAAP